MNKQLAPVLIIVAIIGVTFWLLADYQPPAEPLDWSVSLSKESKQPFGNYAVYDLLMDLFPDQKKLSESQIYKEAQEADSTVYFKNLAYNYNYVYIGKTFYLSEERTSEFLDYIAHGGHAFIAAYQLNYSLKEQLKLNVNLDPWHALTDSIFIEWSDSRKKLLYDRVPFQATLQIITPPIEDSITVGQLMDIEEDDYSDEQTLEDDPYNYQEDFEEQQETYQPTHTVLAKEAQSKQPVFIKISYGSGYLYLHCQPLVFTNYYLLKPSHMPVIEAALSYLPKKDVIWGEEVANSFGSGDGGSRKRDNSIKELSFLQKKDSLLWALWLALAGLLLFTLFEAKRKQRAIPVIDQLENSTIEFAKTIGHLYYQRGDHRNLAGKQITYLFEFIRTHLNLSIHEPDFSLIPKIAQKAGVSEQEVTELFNLMQHIIINEQQISDNTLIELNKKIENFKKKIIV